MLSMLRSNLYRLVKTRLTWAYAIVCVLLICMEPLVWFFTASSSASYGDPLNPTMTAVQMYGRTLGSGVVFLASVYCAVFFAADFKTKSIKNVLQAKGGRVSYALAAAVTVLVVQVGAMVASSVVAGAAYQVLGFAIAESSVVDLALLFCQFLLVSTAYSLIAVLFVFATGNETLATVATLVVSSGLVESFLRVALANVFADFPPLRDCLDGYLAVQMNLLSAGTVSDAGGIAAAAATCAVALGLCVLVMKKRELAK
ncbi:hypothetical protein [Raoultibacter timonensis]|uniref:hypothetical protein n=1 Tax=Raoultibacter timonensis TaxID=1907662 RepID=UPI0026DB032A|nr:hypothetical protein [Raoultibacter timonensis]